MKLEEKALIEREKAAKVLIDQEDIEENINSAIDAYNRDADTGGHSSLIQGCVLATLVYLVWNSQ